jgi:hypothetical protein
MMSLSPKASYAKKKDMSYAKKMAKCPNNKTMGT